MKLEVLNSGCIFYSGIFSTRQTLNSPSWSHLHWNWEDYNNIPRNTKFKSLPSVRGLVGSRLEKMPWIKFRSSITGSSPPYASLCDHINALDYKNKKFTLLSELPLGQCLQNLSHSSSASPYSFKFAGKELQ
ncbi:hypothetical protein PoB_002942300 [Plakobranchus ocellatus]|uniref:Uncharacterized protein n=1 Tax=Plakobranchus ocellatus TaxID=259542 RepID=A0AAV4A6U2_9GAST|nr:hypothetical protein PoB_002942300 [Plakobranchus ocellatus]